MVLVMGSLELNLGKITVRRKGSNGKANIWEGEKYPILEKKCPSTVP